MEWDESKFPAFNYRETGASLDWMGAGATLLRAVPRLSADGASVGKDASRLPREVQSRVPYPSLFSRRKCWWATKCELTYVEQRDGQDVLHAID